MANPRKTKEELQLSGMYGKRSSHKTYGSSKGLALAKDTIITAPGRYVQRTKLAWNLIVPSLIAKQILGGIDLPILGAMFDMLDEYYRSFDDIADFKKSMDKSSEKDQKTLRGLRKTSEEYLDSFSKIAYRFGITPVERSRLSMPEEEAGDDFDKFMEAK